MLNPIIANMNEVGFNLGLVNAKMSTPVVLVALLALGAAKAYNYMQADETKHITNAQVAKYTAAIIAVGTVAGFALLLMNNKIPAPLQYPD